VLGAEVSGQQDGRYERDRDRLLALVAEGKGIAGACREIGKLSRMSVHRWCAKYPDFAIELAEARKQGIEVWADELTDLADQMEGCIEPAQVAAAKLRIDTRKWLLVHLAPEIYGDKMVLTGKDGRDLIPTQAVEAARVPRLMSVLSVLMPGTSNSELHGMASKMLAKIKEEPETIEGSGERVEE
jgi:hypothetical protein